MADAPDSKSGKGNLVWVRLPPPAPYKSRTYGFSCFSSNGELVPTVMVFSILYSFVWSPGEGSRHTPGSPQILLVHDVIPVKN